MRVSLPKIGLFRITGLRLSLRRIVVINGLWAFIFALCMQFCACAASGTDIERQYEQNVLAQLAHVARFEGYYIGDDPVKTEGGVFFSKVAASTTIVTSDVVREIRAKPTNAGLFYLLIVLYYKDRAAFHEWKHLARGISINYAAYDQGCEMNIDLLERFLKDDSIRRDLCWRRSGEL